MDGEEEETRDRVRDRAKQSGEQVPVLENLREAVEEFPKLFIQSETIASTHEYSESNRVSIYHVYVMCPVSEEGLRHRLVLVLPTVRERENSKENSTWEARGSQKRFLLAGSHVNPVQ